MSTLYSDRLEQIEQAIDAHLSTENLQQAEELCRTTLNKLFADPMTNAEVKDHWQKRLHEIVELKTKQSAQKSEPIVTNEKISDKQTDDSLDLQQKCSQKNGDVSESGTKECPYCAETIKRNAKLCRFCKSELLPFAEPSLHPELIKNGAHFNAETKTSELTATEFVNDLLTPKPRIAYGMVCTNCGHVGPTLLVTPGSGWIEFVLWLLYLFPGLIYRIWRESNKAEVCAVCKSKALVPPSSPTGQRYLNQPHDH